MMTYHYGVLNADVLGPHVCGFWRGALGDRMNAKLHVPGRDDLEKKSLAMTPTCQGVYQHKAATKPMGLRTRIPILDAQLCTLNLPSWIRLKILDHAWVLAPSPFMVVFHCLCNLL